MIGTWVRICYFLINHFNANLEPIKFSQLLRALAGRSLEGRNEDAESLEVLNFMFWCLSSSCTA